MNDDTAELSAGLAACAGAALSLLLSYTPGLSAWFERLGMEPDGSYDGGTRKRLLVLGLLVVTAACAWALACSGWGDLYAGELPLNGCDRPSLAALLRALIAAVMANQSVYAISPRTRRG